MWNLYCMEKLGYRDYDEYIQITDDGLWKLANLKKSDLIYLINRLNNIEDGCNINEIPHERIYKQGIFKKMEDFDVNPTLIISKEEEESVELKKILKSKRFISVNITRLEYILVELSESEIKVLFYIFGMVGFIKETEGELKFPEIEKLKICKKYQLSLRTVSSALSKFVKLYILFKIYRGRYCLNFNIAFRGSYEQRILGWRRLTNKMEYKNLGENGTRIINGIKEDFEKLDIKFEDYIKAKQLREELIRIEDRITEVIENRGEDFYKSIEYLNIFIEERVEIQKKSCIESYVKMKTLNYSIQKRIEERLKKVVDIYLTKNAVKGKFNIDLDKLKEIIL